MSSATIQIQGLSAVLSAAPTEQPLALYVHIPFCVRKCYYCDFNSGPASDAIRDQYVDALTNEIRRSPWAGQRARTVFFGGGTPSELNTPQLRRITDALQEAFDFAPSTPQHPNTSTPDPEWTIECNPGTVTEQSLAEMREMGFNRISLGVQSFHDHHLKAIGRIHTASQAVEAVRAARRAGFRRLNVDLIFCLPGQTLEEWKADLESALALEPEHVSLYNLTIEHGTEFGKWHRQGRLALPDEDLSADMYEWAIDRTASVGFEQYEVSNFALAGEECRHNQIYWRQEPSLGFGISAASYVDGLRWTNTGSMQRYLHTAGGDSQSEHATEERLPPLEAAGETIMLALRTREGVNLPEVAARYGLNAEREWGHLTPDLLADGLLHVDGDRLQLTRRGILLANAVCGLFLPDPAE